MEQDQHHHWPLSAGATLGLGAVATSAYLNHKVADGTATPTQKKLAHDLDAGMHFMLVVAFTVIALGLLYFNTGHTDVENTWHGWWIIDHGLIPLSPWIIFGVICIPLLIGAAYALIGLLWIALFILRIPVKVILAMLQAVKRSLTPRTLKGYTVNGKTIYPHQRGWSPDIRVHCPHCDNFFTAKAYSVHECRTIKALPLGRS